MITYIKQFKLLESWSERDLGFDFGVEVSDFVKSGLEFVFELLLLCGQVFALVAQLVAEVLLFVQVHQQRLDLSVLIRALVLQQRRLRTLLAQRIFRFRQVFLCLLQNCSETNWCEVTVKIYLWNNISNKLANLLKSLGTNLDKLFCRKLKP